MGTAKVVALTARPWKATLLSFEVGGILGQLGLPASTTSTQLGDTVTPFDFTAFYAGLDTPAAIPADNSLLAFNSQGILSSPVVMASALASLRAEPRAAALNRAVYARQNAFYARYSPPAMANIVSNAQTYYGGSTTAKPALLQNLYGLAKTQAGLLATAYKSDGRSADGSGNPLVVQTTNSSLTSTTLTSDSSRSAGAEASTSTTTGSATTTDENNETEISGTPKGGVEVGGGGWPGTADPNAVKDGAWWTLSQGGQGAVSETADEGASTQAGASTEKGSSSETSTGTAYAVQTEKIINTDYTYRVPYVESQAQYARAQISLNDQQFAVVMATQNLSNLTTVLQNESSSVDLSVYQLQLGFLSSILLSPMGGTVTGIYKMPGDAVRPGEPVIAVADNSSIFLLATVVYRGPIAIAPPGSPPPPNSNVSVQTNLFDVAPLPAPLTGTVVALRGRGNDDLWDLVVQCVNPLDGSGNPTFPMGYVFDYVNNTTTFTIT